MYSFEGDFRQKPRQSLGGASKVHKAERLSLLAQTQAKRQTREQNRKEVRSAVIIQSFYRGSKARELLKDVERQQFDCIAKVMPRNLNNLKKNQLLQKLTFFYRLSVDDERLVMMCQLLLQDPTSFTEFVFHQDESLLLLKKLLFHCCQSIQNRLSTTASIAVALRTLDILTNAQVFSAVAGCSETLLASVFEYLINRGYYRLLRTLCDQKIPPCRERSSTPPTPLAQCILTLILRPMGCDSTKSRHYRDIVMSSFCTNFFSAAYTHQVYDFIVPALTAPEMTTSQFSIPDLIKSISHTLLPSKSCSCEIVLSSTLLHSLLVLVTEKIETLSESDGVCYLELLGNLFLRLVEDEFVCQEAGSDSIRYLRHPLPDDCVTNVGPLSFIELRQQCLERLNSPKHVNAVIAILMKSENAKAVHAICSVGHIILEKFKCQVQDSRLLYSLCYNTQFIRNLWEHCLAVSADSATGSSLPLIQMLARDPDRFAEATSQAIPLLSLFCSLFKHSLMSLHDADFYGDKTVLPSTTMPFTLSELVTIASLLRNACLGIVSLAVPDTKSLTEPHYLNVLRRSEGLGSHEGHATNRAEWIYLFKVLSQLINHLYDRDARRGFCAPGHWLPDQVTLQANQLSRICKDRTVLTWQPLEDESMQESREDAPQLSVTDTRNLVILQELPFVFSFQERVKIFHQLVRHDKEQHQREMDFALESSINITVRRSHLYEDSFEKLSLQNEPTMKPKVRVHMLNVTGLDEAGIDGGGIFREFLTELLKTSFDPNRGFFTYTENKLLYPNPQVHQLVPNYHEHFFFIGRLLGKALYEQMLVELPLASFFVSKLLSKNEAVDFHHLASLDPEMYRNLLFVKNYGGDVTELGLDFTVMNSLLDVNKADELKPGGKDIAVTAYNVIEYIHLMADYRLNKQIRSQCVAFSKGIEDVINLPWLRMFNPNELQTLLSGAPIPIDLEDLKKHTQYSGGYTEDHPVMLMFWRVVSRFDDKQRRLLLKFVTSCSRPPLLGFKDLYPAFCIHFAGTEDRLPTSSTCMNLLKLPEYKDDTVLAERLIYAIESGAGFELS